MSKSSYTPEFRAKIAQEYLNGNCSRKDLSKKYNIQESTFRDWINVYKTHGINAFINTNGNKQYTKDFKIQCVEAVLKGESSVLDVVSQYQISSSHMLRKRISLYNANRELKDYIPKREVYMADARRKTTIEERKEIVDYCIEKGITVTPGCVTPSEVAQGVKRGLKVCRQGWNGKSQYIELASNISYKSAKGDIVNCVHECIGNKAIAFVGTSGVQMGWLASQADMLAEDWMFAE